MKPNFQICSDKGRRCPTNSTAWRKRFTHPIFLMRSLLLVSCTSVRVRPALIRIKNKYHNQPRPSRVLAKSFAKPMG